ncbi:MAG: hypothetical protein BWY24_00853 [Microgenomates group bacterium ADurb.Bin219]|nr:MAG: hypothetical protein BWY24_00853 [Microgenomates group bacterium ADurb.Bin219]HNP89464.1 PHP-associated domain-containing protein [Candidatus Woesebacteria bacterium]
MIERKGNFAADLHGHSFLSGELMSWYSVDSALEQASRIGLNIIAFTEHSSPLSQLGLKFNIVGRTLKARRDRGLSSPLVILGQEVSCREGNTFPHVLVFGHDLSSSRIKPIPALKSVEETIRIAHQAGLLVVAAHPTPEPTFASLSYRKVREVAEKMPDAWDGVETTSLRRGKDEEAIKIARELGITGYAGSDYHRLAEIGMAGAYFSPEVPFSDSEAVLDYLRTKPNLETFVDLTKLPKTRNLMLWLRNRVNRKNGR